MMHIEVNSSQPLVTVYIPCRNYGRFLTQAVKSVLRQLYGNWELFIIDEGSTDETYEIASHLVRKDPDRIRLIRNDSPIGLQRIANRILNVANGKYIVRLDADDWLDESALLVMCSKLEASPDLGLVYGNYYYTDESGAVIGLERRHKLGIEDKAGHLAPHGACTMVRTRALKSVGGYSEDINAQDGWELWYKLSGRVGAASLDIPVFYYRQHGSSLSRDADRLLQARARIFERLSQSLNGSYNPSCLAVIPVRESYPDFEGVPYRIYNGKSLLENAIFTAQECRHVTEVLVSTESQQVIEFSTRLESEGLVGKHTRILRSPKVRSNAIPIKDILVEAAQCCRDQNGAYPDIVMFLSLHALARKASHLDKAINVLRLTECDSVVSVREEREPIFVHGENGLRLLNPGRFSDIALDRERLYRFNGCVIASWWEVLGAGDLLGERIGYVEMSASDSLQLKSGVLA